jgi:hypothetical protein
VPVSEEVLVNKHVLLRFAHELLDFCISGKTAVKTAKAENKEQVTSMRHGNMKTS